MFENGEQRVGRRGAPEHHLMMFKRDQVTIEDTWHVSGLRGTGSHHYQVSNAFVPEGRSVVMGGRGRFERPLYQFPMLGLLAMGVSSVSLGIGWRALDAFKELADTKVPTGAVKGLASQYQDSRWRRPSPADPASGTNKAVARICRALP